VAGSRSDAFGELLRTARLQAGLSQEALASRARLSADAVAALERGRRRMPRLATVVALAAALDLPPPDRARLLAAARPAPSAHPGTPPAPPHPLRGRQDDLARLGSLLRVEQNPMRLVTVTGPAGVGKTALALATASRHREEFPDGAAWIDLALITQRELVARHWSPR